MELDSDGNIQKQGNVVMSWTERSFMDCRRDSCGYQDYLFMQDLNSKAYLLKIELQEDEFLDGFDYFSFVVYKGNPSIFKSLVAFRYSMMGLSFITAVLFLLHFLRIKRENRTIEHYFVMLLGFSLVIFNDPLIYNTMVNPSQATTVISTLFVCQFVAFFVYCFTVICLRMHKREFSPLSNLNTIFVKLGGVIYFALISVPTCIYNSNVQDHPSYYSDKPYETTLIVFAIIALVVTVAIFVGIIVVVCRSLGGKSVVPLRFVNMSQDIFTIIIYQLVIFVTGFYHYASELPGRNIVYFLACNILIWYFQIKFYTF